jgi:hypothetical protein
MCPRAAAPPRPRVIAMVRTFGRWDCINARQRERAKEPRFAACTSLLTSPATRRPPPKCGAFRLQPRGSPLRQTGFWRKGDSNCRSRLETAIPGLASSISWRAAVPVPRGPSCLDGPRFRIRPSAPIAYLAERVGQVRRVRVAKASTVIPNSRWIVWPNSCARRGRARAAAGSASPRTRPRHWRRRWPSGRRSG